MTDAPTEPIATAAPAPAAAPTGAALTCRGCAAPLAADQRYCLGCGMRVAAPRVDYLDVLAGGASIASPGAPAAKGSQTARSIARFLDRIGGPMGAAAVVLIALGVGYLLGQSAGTDTPATIVQRPPVVNVQGGGTAAAPPADPTATTGSPTTGARGGKSGGRGGDAGTAGVPKATPDAAGGDLNRLQQQPTEQATQGAAPKRDSKPAGGGTDAETIG